MPSPLDALAELVLHIAESVNKSGDVSSDQPGHDELHKPSNLKGEE